MKADTLGDGPLAIDDDESILWIAGAEDGEAVLHRLDPSTGTVQRRALPHPRFSRLFLTSEGIWAAEYTIPDGPEAEALRLVRLELDANEVGVEPKTEFEPDLTDVGVSKSTETRVFVLGSGAQTQMRAEGRLSATRMVGGARIPDIPEGGDVIGFLPDTGFYSTWHPGTDRLETVSRTWAYTSSMSTDRMLAVGEMDTENGPTGRVCISALAA